MSEEGEVAGVVAALLAQGRRIDRLSRLLTAAALIALLVLPVSFGLPATLPTAALAAVALVGFAEMYLAFRVDFDAALFARLAHDPDTAGLDRGLLAIGLLPAAKAGRPLGDRARGAQRLLFRQGICLAAQALLILAAAAFAAAGGGT